MLKQPVCANGTPTAATPDTAMQLQAFPASRFTLTDKVAAHTFLASNLQKEFIAKKHPLSF